MQFADNVYDKLKFIALVLLPGFSAAYFGLSQIWGLPHVEQVVGTATVIDTFLGLVLKNSTKQYNKSGGGTDGDLLVNHDPEDGSHYLSLGVKQDTLSSIPAKNTVTLRVVDNTVPPTV